MSDYRTGGFELPLSHHDEFSLTRWSMWFLVTAVLLLTGYAMIWSAAYMRAAHNPPDVIAVPRQVR